MDYEQILFEITDQVATITLNRPEQLNAFTFTMSQEMRDALQRAEEDDHVRVIILTGAGRGFCAGMDLSGGEDAFDFSKKEFTPEEERERSDPPVKFFPTLKKPVIVAINGPAVGIGASMSLLFDIRIAAESARIGFVFNRRGVLPEMASPWILPRMIGFSKAAEILLTGRFLSASEALEIGLVSEVVPDEDLLPTARALARDIADNCAPVSVALTKTMLTQFMFETDIDKIVRINHRYFDWTGEQPDAFEGVKSFLDKRPPRWTMKVSKDMPDFFPLK